MRRLAVVLLFVSLPAFADIPSRPTLAFVLEAIRDRALNAYRMDTIALEGLNGLATIDPAFDAAKTAENRVQLHYRGHDLASFAIPMANDPAGWAQLLENAAREAAHASPAIGKADGDQLTEAIADGFLSRLDIFSHYAGPKEAMERRASRNGFGGIGVRYDSGPEFVTLTEVMPESPAAQARLRVGDRILAIDGVKLAGHDQAEITQMLRGPVASPIKLTIQRDNLTLTLRRSLIVPPTVSVTLQDGIAVIAVSGFNEETADSVTDAVRKAKTIPNFKGIVLDLRGNPGGLLDQGIRIADHFIPEGKILLTKGRHPGAAQHKDAKSGDPGEGIPLVALVDGRTASAAEILAADLQDSGRAVLVGSNSFGKGAIQTVLDLPNDGEMTLTWSRFYAPSGYALHGLGVLPNICTVPSKSKDDQPLAGGRAAAASFYAEWRSVGPDDMANRAKLRHHCPAGDHADDRADLTIAKRLLNDHVLYAKALAVAAPISQASSLKLPLPTVH